MMHLKHVHIQIKETRFIWWWLLFAAAAVICLFLSLKDKLAAETFVEGTHKYVIVIDAGHGGNDPGKVGANGVLEKDINLSIAYKLAEILEANDVYCIMTRKGEDNLASEYQGSGTTIKSADMRQRIKIMEENAPDLIVSIHQNSFPSTSCRGAQVFYYSESEEGRKAARIIQESFVREVDSENRRAAKADSSYYILKKSTYPAVIVECGFLSNPEEEELLNSKEYQRKVAWAVFMGIMVYLNTK